MSDKLVFFRCNCGILIILNTIIESQLFFRFVFLQEICRRGGKWFLGMGRARNSGQKVSYEIICTCLISCWCGVWHITMPVIIYFWLLRLLVTSPVEIIIVTYYFFSRNCGQKRF